jgi:hypothetical protein
MLRVIASWTPAAHVQDHSAAMLPHAVLHTSNPAQWATNPHRSSTEYRVILWFHARGSHTQPAARCLPHGVAPHMPWGTALSVRMCLHADVHMYRLTLCIMHHDGGLEVAIPIHHPAVAAMARWAVAMQPQVVRQAGARPLGTQA